MKNILINATNLHFGGGVQVASSFIYELSKLLNGYNELYSVSVLCSDKVYQSFPFDFDKSIFHKFEVVNVYGIRPPSKYIKSKFNYFDVCFSVFGPLYFTPKVKTHICGFAQPWIAYPINPAYNQLSLKEHLINKFKFKVQSYCFQRYEHLIVEQVHVKNALVEIGYNKDVISVVSNCVSSIYDDTNSWLPLVFDDSYLIENITLGFIGRAYPHKNIQILNKVNKILISKYRMKCNFLFTFSSDEMDLCGFSEISNFHSVGEITSTQCPLFYHRLDALVFPSLLECFSASPIEAMKMNITVIASGYPFVEEVCGDAAFYFNPLNAENIAEVIYNAFSNDMLREEKKQTGRQIVSNLPTAKDRAVSYLDIIENSIR